ncbi:MAG TPA: hypothetical protein PKV98_16355 [Burkholderiaceae bacterium]|nr:hypothetical protein [Burkholderiaceae bacterium]
MRSRYWHDRCERWGAWRVGAKGASIAPWARMRDGTPAGNADDAAPELHLEERDTDELVRLLPTDLKAFLRLVYPWQSRIAASLGIARQTLYERLDAIHRTLARMLDQRRRGEPIDPQRRRQRPRVEVMAVRNERGRKVRLAAVQRSRED